MTAPEPSGGEVTPPRRSLLRYLPIVVIIVVIGIGFAMGWHDYLTLQNAIDARQTIRQFAADYGVLAAIAFVLGYAAAVAVAFPATWVLTVMGGAVFGLIVGGLLTAIGATLGATVLFLAARTAFGDVLRKSAQGFVAKVSAGFKRNAFSYLLALRLAPILPFTVVNVLPALFNVSIAVFVTATLLGILPGVFVYAAIGAGIDDIVARAAADGRELELADLVSPVLVLGLLGLAVLAILPTLVRAVLERRKRS